MDIFSDCLDYEDVDFSVWFDEDGEGIEIEELEDEEIRNALIMLDRKIKMLPEHENIEIWEEYRRIFKEML
ncbi:MAG: hypothetical protein E7256_11505 [Lachnospiraceae bacterium]|nr:hypothetical protein [Lachnospiraceae bacterium]